MEMKGVLAWVQGVALSLGGPGLFLIAFLDSSFLSFPEVVDLLIIWMTTRHKALMPYYATLSTLGSIAGCFALYTLARKGGETFLRKRFHERHVDRAMGAFRKHGLLAVIVPSLLPPPAPFKIFVLAAGVADVAPLQFVVAVAIGRGLRYFGEGLLALWYGERAIAFMHDNAKTVSLALAIAILVGGVGWAVWQRRSRAATAAD
jgi:membrane protein YqaA with SNARE-associated domain